MYHEDLMDLFEGVDICLDIRNSAAPISASALSSSVSV